MRGGQGRMRGGMRGGAWGGVTGGTGGGGMRKGEKCKRIFIYSLFI